MFSHKLFKYIFSAASILAIVFNTIIPITLYPYRVSAQEPPSPTPAHVPILEPPKPGQEPPTLNSILRFKTSPITPTLTPQLTVQPDRGVAQQPAPPNPNDFPPEANATLTRESIQTALNKYLSYLGPRYQLTLTDIAIEGNWAYASTQWQSEARMTDEPPIYILAHRLPDGSWQALLPDGEGLYIQWLKSKLSNPLSNRGPLQWQTRQLMGGEIQ